MKIKLKLIISVAIVSTLMLSCTSSTKEGEKNTNSETSNETSSKDVTKLEGSWEIVKAEGSMASDNMGTVYSFSGDKLELRGGAKGTFVISGDTIKVKYPNFVDGKEQGSMDFNYLHKFENSQLVLNVLGSDQKFYLDKK